MLLMINFSLIRAKYLWVKPWKRIIISYSFIWVWLLYFVQDIIDPFRRNELFQRNQIKFLNEIIEQCLWIRRGFKRISDCEVEWKKVWICSFGCNLQQMFHEKERFYFYKTSLIFVILWVSLWGINVVRNILISLSISLSLYDLLLVLFRWDRIVSHSWVLIIIVRSVHFGLHSLRNLQKWKGN